MRPIIHFFLNPVDFLSSFLKKYGRFIPDPIYLRWQYRLQMGRKLNLKSPKTFTEKIQWLKVHNRKSEMTTMVDKYAVKDFVAKRIGSKYIIPTLGVWNSLDEIDWNSLPERFVLKTTHGGGSTGVVVVKHKSEVSREETLNKLSWSFNHEGYTATREWPYKDVPKRIIAEEYIEMPGKVDLTDYKIYCFNGKARYIQVIQDRHTCETIDFFDTNWNHQEFVGLIPKINNPKIKNADKSIPSPRHLDEMIDVAETLAHDQDFVRIDMYEVEERLLFGEITFFPASGIGSFTPNDYDMKLGELINLSK